ncbi:anti-sigma factor family protein [Kribbella sp. CA-293567]|uniref:anti-sigma factor family protein n=1 Tax=Kribbella sp. CA-293567 TaxID=3002436 RepID=UPI0022DDB486|nr:zf-HC2 domain-containing protein [Kribbella sp. CA-293567]WBQ04732.1 zf-HC2 domain-containing protein [Kribbella sp. CA-293567]
MSDPYRQWDAAYLLGALSASDRRAYEEHLRTCPECSAEVASLAGVPGTLAVLPDDRALATITAPPPNLLPGLVRSVQRDQRRKRYRLAAVVAATAATAAVAGVVLQGTLGKDEPAGDTVVLAQTVASKLTADARLVDEPWGTTIEISCRYDELATPSERARGYELYVTDDTGKATLLATWTAAPGTTVKPATTTKLHRDQIKGLDIRGAESGRVLLAITF